MVLATSENTDCGVREWNKIQSYTEKIKFSFFFMLLFAIFMFLPTRQLSRQKTCFFPSHFASIFSCSACLVGIIWGKMSLNTILTIRTQEIGSQKWRKMWKSAWRRALKKRYVSAISDISGSIAGRNFRLGYCMLNLLGKTFSWEFIETLFFTNIENKNRNFTVIFTIYFHWEISIIHRKAYKKWAMSW